MFKVGDKVVCICNFDDGGNLYDLIIYDIYEILNIHKGIDFIDYDYIKVVGSDYQWETYNFLSITDYIKSVRRDKLNKIVTC